MAVTEGKSRGNNVGIKFAEVKHEKRTNVKGTRASAGLEGNMPKRVRVLR
jgi:hypothetical protein